MTDENMPAPAVSLQTRMEQEFLAHLCSGMTIIDAALTAGYPRVTPRLRALLVQESVVMALSEHTARQLRGEDRSRARAVLRGIMDDDKQPARTRIAAAATILNMAQLAERQVIDKYEKNVSEMSAVELEEMATELKSLINNRNVAEVAERQDGFRVILNSNDERNQWDRLKA